MTMMNVYEVTNIANVTSSSAGWSAASTLDSEEGKMSPRNWTLDVDEGLVSRLSTKHDVISDSDDVMESIYPYPMCGSANNSNNFNDSGWDLVNGTMSELQPEDTFSSAFQVAIYILYNTVFIAAVLGNILVCYVVFSSPKMRTVTNYLIANLALGDLLMAILCVPFSYIPVLYQYWPFGQILCHVLSPAQAVCVFVSAYTLVALAADRYMAILYPLKPRLRRSQAVIVILVVWAVAIFTATPIALYTTICVDVNSGKPICQEAWTNENLKLYYSLTLMILQYFFPLAVLVFTYTRIALAVWGKKAPGEAEDGRDQRLAKAKRKTVVMTLAVVAGYTLAWLPMNCLNLVMDLVPSVLGPPPPKYMIYVYFTCHWLAMAHTTYNPLIYAWINSRFRSAFKSTLSKTIKMMLTVVAVYTISWLPFNTLIVCADIQGSDFWGWGPISYIFIAVHWMAMSHTVCNPIIYCWMNIRFRQGFKAAAYRLPCISRFLAAHEGPNFHERQATVTTFTFAPNGHNRLIRGASLISNRTVLSDNGAGLGGLAGGVHSLSPCLSPAERFRAHQAATNNSTFYSNAHQHHLPNQRAIRPPYANVVNPRLNNNPPSTSPAPSTMMVSLNHGGCPGRRGSSRRESMESFM